MNLFSLAYKNISGRIEGTNFSHGDYSLVYKSPLNTYTWNGRGARAVLSKPIGEAIVSLFDGTILGVGRTKEEMFYIECLENKEIYQILYEPQSNIIQIYSKNIDIDTSIITKFFFIPIIVADIVEKSNQEMLLYLQGLREVYNRKGLPFDKEDPHTEKYFYLSHDYFYFQHKGTEYAVVVDPIVEIKIKEDLTYEVIQKNSDFKIIKLQQRKTKTPSASTQIVVPKIDFGEPLSEEMMAKIPNLPDWMKVPEKLIPVEKSIATGKVLSTLMYGPAGGGKTTNCKLICRDIGLPLIAVVNCTTNLDEFILGKFVPKGNEFIFFKSEVTEAIEWGGAVVFEEINFGRPEHLAFLNSLLDDNGFVRLDNGEVIKRHPCFRFFATMNYGYAGTVELNKALFNRFQAKIKIKDLSDEQIINLLLNKSNVSERIAKDMIVVYRKIQTKLTEEGREEVISPRDILNWALQSEDSDPLQAAEFTVIAIAEDDEELEDEIRDIVKMKF